MTEGQEQVCSFASSGERILAAGLAPCQTRVGKNMTSGNNPDSPDKPLTPYRQQRAVPRYAFFGMTELTDSAGSRTLSGKVEEISRKGCYVDTMNVFPEGTSVHVRISHNREAFVTSGEVLYVRERRGMGIAFVGTPNDQLGILDSWLAERASIVAII